MTHNMEECGIENLLELSLYSYDRLCRPMWKNLIILSVVEVIFMIDDGNVHHVLRGYL